MKLRVAAAAIAGLALALTPVLAAHASVTAHESLAGIETGVPQPSAECPSGSSVELSPFAGAAGGSTNGTWSAGACHGNIPGTAGQSVPLLPGGSFSVSGVSTHVQSLSLHGVFGPGNGSITLVKTTGVSWAFNTQVFAITGPLTGGNIHSGTMSVTLTHYRFGTQTLEASITGSATLTY